MGRYDNVLGMTYAKQNVPNITISDRETDIYLEFNSADRLDLLSYRIYGASEYWWLILAANEYQIEFDIPYGEILRVPYPLADVLNEIRENI